MYQSIVENTCAVLDSLPTPIPDSGILAGFGREITLPYQDMFLNDNYHFPMGTAFLEYGIPGVAEKAAASALTVSDPLRRELLESISLVYRRIGNYFRRYARAAEQAAAGKDARLLRMAAHLSALADRRPEHFDEALQLVFLLWRLRLLHSRGGDIGRLDVHLRPFYQRDMETGYTNDREVLELLCEFWRWLNRVNSGDSLINVMVGGKNPDGTDAGSQLSVLMLHATKRCALTEPHINVRVHRQLNPAIYQAMLEVQFMGQGQAAVYNDEVIIPSLIRRGVPEELAYAYTNDGCTEIMLDGYSGIEFHHIDAVATFELAFNNGRWGERAYSKPIQYWHKDGEARYYTPDAVPGFASGDPECCTTFQEFLSMFLAQYRFQTWEKAEDLRQRQEALLREGRSSVLLNGTYAFVLDSGLDILHGGFPYTNYMLFSGSLPTVADCLMAVKKAVFDEKRFTIPQIKAALKQNFEGYEAMRQYLLSAPKFGNDNDQVDSLAACLANHFCDWLTEYQAQTAFTISPALVGWRFLEEAYGISATPDGRRYGDPIAEHFCPTPGRAVNGPTVILQSVAKASDAIAKANGVCAVHLSLPRNLGDSDEAGLTILNALVSGALDSGLNHLNIAIYDAQLLKLAQQDPEHHRDIVVRVWGYSARFVDLCKEMQNHVISRIVRTA